MLVADSIDRLALQALVDEVGSFFIPTSWDIVVADLNLTAEYLVSDILSSPAFIGPLAHHALIGDHAHGKVVGSKSVILAAHDLWCHVARRATRLTCIVRAEDPSNTEISQSKVAFIVEHKILRLDVPMYYQLGMDCIESMNKTCNEETGDLHRELALARNMIP